MKNTTEILREQRKSKRLNQSDLAGFLNIATSTYGSYELGKVSIPIDILIKIADFYKISIDYILGRTTDKMTAEDYKFITDLDLSNDELMKKYTISADGVELTRDDILNLIDIAKILKDRDNK